MKIPRFYQAEDFQVEQELALSAANHRHAIQVLRLRANDLLIVFNGMGGEYTARLIVADKRKSSIKIESFEKTKPESALFSMVYMSMIKPERMDFAIQKMVELGVSEIQPMYTTRSVIKIKANRLEKKMQHWQGIIIAACEQSGRTQIPKIRQPKTIEECLNDDNNSTAFVMLPGKHAGILQHKEAHLKHMSLFIGPEGGFTEAEEQLLQEYGIQPISFGKRILRAETAAIAGLTACQLKWGDLSK